MAWWRKKDKTLEAKLTGINLIDPDTGTTYEQALVPIQEAEDFRSQNENQLADSFWTKIRPFFKSKTSDTNEANTTDTANEGTLVGGEPASAMYYDRMQFEQSRSKKYDDYKRIAIDSPICALGLKVTVDNAYVSTKGDQESYKVESDNPKVQTILEETDQRLELHDFSKKWCKTTLQFGDSFIERIVDNKGYIIRLKWLNPKYMFRNTDEYGRLDSETSYYMESDTERIANFKYFQVSHVRYDHDLSNEYGNSFFHLARKPFRQLEMMKEGIVIRRLSRASKRYAYTVPMREGTNIIEQQKKLKAVKESLKRQKITDSNGKLDYRKRPRLEDDDIYLPGFKDNPAKVEMFDPGGYSDSLLDVHFIRDEEIVAIGVPPAYLGLDKEVRGRAHLGWIDIQYARVVRGVQKMMAKAHREIYDLQLLLMGITDAEYKILFPAISFIDERIKWEVEQLKWQIVSEVRNGLGIPMRWLLESIIGMPQDMVDEILADDDYQGGDLSNTANPGGMPIQTTPALREIKDSIFQNKKMAEHVAELRDKLVYIQRYGLTKQFEG